MPQMSPLGWVWLIVLVIFGYFLIMMLMYYLYCVDFFFEININKKGSIKWLW